MRASSTILVLVAVLGTAAGRAGTVDADSDIDRATRWHQPAATILDVDFGDASGFHSRWEYFHCDCGDVLIRLEQSAPDSVITGELLLVDGQVLAARGAVADAAGDLEDMLQAPLLMLHLAFALLERGVPEGPAAVGEKKQRFEVKEAFNSFQLNSGQSSGTFGAPWRVTGQVWAGAEARRRFEMTFEFTVREPGADDATSRIRLSGGQDYRSGAFPLHATASLENWRIQWLSKGETAARPADSGLSLQALRDQAKSPP